MTIRHAALLAAALLAACDRRDSGRDADTTGSAPAATATPNVVTVTARDFAFALPDTVPAGLTTIRLVNEGPELHHAQLVRFEEGKTLQDYQAAMQAMKPGDPEPSWAVAMGGPNPPAPGAETSITQMLEPGNYAVICLVDTPDRVPHIKKGMFRPLVVTPAAAAAEAPPPAADITLRLVDYTFETSTPLTPGTHTIRIVNGAQQPHEVFLAQLPEGKTLDDLMKWAQTYDGPPPAKPLGGVAAIRPGAEAYMTVDLEAGQYAMLCFVPDAKDGRPHVAHGMAMAVTVQ